MTMANLKRKPNTEEEIALLKALLNGRRDRWTEFSRDELEDLVSDVWLALLRDDMKKLRAYCPEKGFRLASWIALIANTATIDRLRARQSDDLHVEDMSSIDIASQSAEPDE